MLPRTLAIGTLILALGNGAAHAQTTAPATAPATTSATASEAASKRLSAERAEDAANLVTRDKLEGNLKEIISDHQSLEKVLNYLSDNIGAKIDVNWPTLEADGITRTTPVSVNLREVPFRKVLATILAQAGDGENNLAYTVEGGTILVSTREDLQSEKHQADRTFDIRAMLPLDDKGDKFSPQAIANILDTIKSTVTPDSWKDNKGNGTVTEKDGILTVHQTRDNLVAVNNLLAQLYETRAIQIAVESRVLILPKNFLDDFRIGWDRSIPDAAAPKRTIADPPKAFPAAVIDNRMLATLETATQSDKRTITSTRPRAIVPNGDSKWLGTPETAAPIFGQTPTLGHAPYPSEFELALDLTPTVITDRRNIVLAINHARLHITGTRRLEVTVAATGPATPATMPAESSTTKITLPDGGTLLINAGNIPGDPDNHVVLVLIRPNIIIHREIENDLFGPGYDRPTGFPEPGTRPANPPANPPTDLP